MPTDRIFLVGPMGAGKTTIGRRLAKLRGMAFIDCDDHIQECTGVDIPYIFEKEGEPGFRQREEKAIDELTLLPNVVMATGGGAVLSDQNRKHLRSRGLVIYLEASVQQQWQRTRRSKHRPLLQTENPKAKLQALFDIRDPLYRQIADIILITDGNTRGLAKKLNKLVDQNRDRPDQPD